MLVLDATATGDAEKQALQGQGCSETTCISALFQQNHTAQRKNMHSNSAQQAPVTVTLEQILKTRMQNNNNNNTNITHLCKFPYYEYFFVPLRMTEF